MSWGLCEPGLAGEGEKPSIYVISQVSGGIWDIPTTKVVV